MPPKSPPGAPPFRAAGIVQPLPFFDDASAQAVVDAAALPLVVELSLVRHRLNLCGAVFAAHCRQRGNANATKMREWTSRVERHAAALLELLVNPQGGVSSDTWGLLALGHVPKDQRFNYDIALKVLGSPYGDPPRPFMAFYSASIGLRYIRDMAEFSTQRLDQFIKEGGGTTRKQSGGRTRKQDGVTNVLIDWLLPSYMRFFGQPKPTVTTNAVTNTYDGPLVRFVAEVLRVIALRSDLIPVVYDPPISDLRRLADEPAALGKRIQRRISLRKKRAAEQEHG